MERLEVLDSRSRWKLQRAILSSFLIDYFSSTQERIHVLEAGCGTAWNLDLGTLDFVLTGLDVSEEALELRQHQQNDLDEIVVGDLQTIELSDAQYDMIYCSYVLEHVSGAEEVLNKLFRWLKPNRLLVLLIPDRDTVLGFITRCTPFWSHVFFYKYIRRLPNAGKPGQVPFQTYYDKVVSRRGIHDYCRSRGHKILLEYGHAFNSSRTFGVFAPLLDILLKLIELISFRRLSSDHSGLVYVIEKSPQ
ncbi:MAG: class I SAM-dependent methyltransferase [Candidatus Eiseniibacteriota bacterium]|nr:MAG: class I SAM-dependent methyltransferase [Candidatus Eisenbacteria bacterium]